MAEVQIIKFIRDPMWRPQDPEKINGLLGGTMMVDALVDGKCNETERFQIKFCKASDIQRFVEQTEESSFYLYRSGVHMYTLTKTE